MCFSMPKMKPLPTPPRADSDAVRQREALERERLLASQGSAGTVKTDLNPSSIRGQRRVLMGV